MTPLVWFAIALATAWVYSTRAQPRIVPRFQLDWRAALVLIGSLAVGTLLLVRGGVALDVHIARYLHPIVIAVMAWLGLYFWIAQSPWRFCCPAIAVVLTVAYTVNRGAWNNAIVVIVALAVVPASMYLARSWAYVFYLALAALDGYAVWGSETMNALASHAQATFPSALVLNQPVGPLLRPLMRNMSASALNAQQAVAWVLVSLREVGLLDVVLACMAVALVVRFSGRRAGIVVAVILQALVVALGVTIIYGPFKVKEVPFLLLLAPTVVGFLAITSRRPACS